MFKDNNIQQPLSDAIIYFDPKTFIPVDEWEPAEEDIILKGAKGVVILNVSEFFGCEPNINLDTFVLTSKRSYSTKTKPHTEKYINYFLKFYDYDKELLAIYYRLKYLIDYEASYNIDAFIYDLQKYIMNGFMRTKIQRMVDDNYSLSLNYRHATNEALQYTDKHAICLMHMSVTINIMIPLMCHFMFVKGISNTQEFLLTIYDILIHSYEGIDLYNKLYETSLSRVVRNVNEHRILWDMQDIRGINPTTHAQHCVENILVNICPKYRFDENLIRFNFKSIDTTNNYRIVTIGYEASFISYSSSKRDIDNNSEFDKFESFLTKAEEALYIQSKVNSEATMELIDLLYGPFDEEDISYYISSMSNDGKFTINSFQRDLVFNLFYKYFGDPESINAINLTDYIKLIIASRRILESIGMVLLPFIISSKVVRLVGRKNVNKKELVKLESSPLYEIIKDKYRNEKIVKQILNIIAIILTSEFRIIDPDDQELDKMKISVIPELVCEEILMYVTLI